MARRVFFSFQYNTDIWRVQQIRNMHAISNDDAIFYDHADLEKVFKQSDVAVENWIENQLKGCSCIAVLIGENTYNSKWVQHEIKRGHALNKAMFGIYIHNLKDVSGNTSKQGRNVFEYWQDAKTKTCLSNVYHVYNPSFIDPYNDIKRNLGHWIDTAFNNANR